MIITPSLSIRTATLNNILNALDAGTGPAILELYAGTKPSGPDASASGNTKLGTLTCSSPAGVIAILAGIPTLTFNAITLDSSADATGTATWIRLSSSGTVTVPVLDADVTNTGGGGFAVMNTINIVGGGPITAPSVVLQA